MKKSLFILISCFVLCVVTVSCDWLFEDTFEEDDSIKSEEVKTKEKYKAFSQLVNPLVFTLDTTNDIGNCNGLIAVVWDTQKDELYDWVHTDRTWNSNAESLLCAKASSGTGNYYVCFDLGYRDSFIMDPAKTQLTFYPQTISGSRKLFSSFQQNPPQKLLVRTSSFNNVLEKSGIALNTFDPETGKYSETIGVMTKSQFDDYSSDPDGNFWFMRTFEKESVLCKFDVSSNSVQEFSSFKFDLEALKTSLGIEPDKPDEDGNITFTNYFVNFYVMYVNNSYAYVYERLTDADNNPAYYLYQIDRQTLAQKKLLFNFPFRDEYDTGDIITLFENNGKLLLLYVINQGDLDVHYYFDEIDFDKLSQKEYYHIEEPGMSYDDFVLRGNKVYATDWSYYTYLATISSFDLIKKEMKSYTLDKTDFTVEK